MNFFSKRNIIIVSLLTFIGFGVIINSAKLFSDATLKNKMFPPVVQPGPAADALRFAVIGDYGSTGFGEANVAELVKGWQPQFIISLGDNNYSDGAHFDKAVGQYYQEFLYPYQGVYGQGALDKQNHFFPVLGNHDWEVGLQAYENYFSLPGNERYYTFTQGPVQFFAVDSDMHEPNGTTATSVQALWLKQQLSASRAPWNVVYFHHAPFSSGRVHGSSSWMQWPFQAWGASLVLSGHEHTYERIEKNGITYVVNGLGGEGRYAFGKPVAGSVARYNQQYGAILVEADKNSLTMRFINVQGAIIDQFTLNKT